MICFKLPPVLDSKNVLLDHLKAKLKHFVIDTIVSDIAIELYKKYSRDEICKLLQDEQLLKEAVLSM